MVREGMVAGIAELFHDPNMQSVVGGAIQWETKCWGRVWHVFHSPHAAVSYLEFLPRKRCSIHKHDHRANQFTVLSGSIIVETWDIDGQRLLGHTGIQPGGTFTVLSGVYHRFRTVESGRMIEVYWPDRGGVVSHDDITRFDVGGDDGDS